MGTHETLPSPPDKLAVEYGDGSDSLRQLTWPVNHWPRLHIRLRGMSFASLESQTDPRPTNPSGRGTSTTHTCFCLIPRASRRVYTTGMMQSGATARLHIPSGFALGLVQNHTNPSVVLRVQHLEYNEYNISFIFKVLCECAALCSRVLDFVIFNQRRFPALSNHSSVCGVWPSSYELSKTRKGR